MTNNNLKKDREQYISKLENATDVIDSILSLEGKDSIIGKENQNKIRDYYEKNKIYIDKLKNEKFELAIVGLEKAGKSTFANALISNNVLPTASTRCTYTQTQLQYGDKDEATVEFYTKEEFNNNIFREILNDLKYDNANNLSFDTLSLEDFENYFNNLENTNKDLYKANVGKTNEDIKDIIRGKDTILQYLNSKPKIFTGSEIRGEELKSFITDPIRSRAVKKITIKTSELKNMKNVVVYDVPGFDSPTKIHEDQTLERLRKADGIVLVTNVGDRPNLTGPQLNVLLKESDYDGIKLNQKLFIFGNKIDSVKDRDSGEINIDALKNDAVNKYKIVIKDRLFTGSANAYLQKKGIEKGKEASSKLAELKYDDRIEDIYKALVEYNKKERFIILKRRIDKNIEELKGIFQKIKEENREYFTEIDFSYIDYLDRKTFADLLRGSKDKIENELSQLRHDIKNDILQNKYFTYNLRTTIDEALEPISDSLVEDTRVKIGEPAGREYAAEKINSATRARIYILIIP